MKNLRQITVAGLGLLGGSVTLAVNRALRAVTTVGFAHRPSTRAKAKRLRVAHRISGDLKASIAEADIVILATPVCTFEGILRQIADSLKPGCIVTDVGSTKVMPHRWANRLLPKSVHYVGSHPIAGSEQRGVEFARDDLFDRALCILTTDRNTNRRALAVLRQFWTALGCRVKTLSPAEHDRIFANVSHLPHITAAALINASTASDLKFAGTGFMDTSRVASGPPNIWADVLLTNAADCSHGIDRIIAGLKRMKKAIRTGNRRKIEKLLETAKTKRSALVEYKVGRKEMI